MKAAGSPSPWAYLLESAWAKFGVCGSNAAHHQTDARGSTVSYCKEHEGDLAAEIAEALRSGPPKPAAAATGPPLRCELCEEPARVHQWTRRKFVEAWEQHYCEKCAAKRLGVGPP
jgi:hypothetical protein